MYLLTVSPSADSAPADTGFLAELVPGQKIPRLDGEGRVEYGGNGEFVVVTKDERRIEFRRGGTPGPNHVATEGATILTFRPPRAHREAAEMIFSKFKRFPGRPGPPGKFR